MRRFHLSAIALVVITCIGLSIDAQEPTTAGAYVQRGNSRQSKDVAGAIADYTKAIELDPRSADAYFHRGLLLFDKEAYDAAIADLSTVITLDPKHANAYLWRGIARMNEYYAQPTKERSYESALADFTQTIKLDPKHEEAYDNRGDLLLYEKHDYDLAIADYTKAIAINSLDYQAYKGRGIARGKMTDYDGAIADLTASLDLVLDADSYSDRATFRRAKRDFIGAIEDYGKAIERAPKNPSYYRERATTYRAIHKTSLAEADERTAGELERSAGRKDH